MELSLADNEKYILIGKVLKIYFSVKKIARLKTYIIFCVKGGKGYIQISLFVHKYVLKGYTRS